MKVSEITIEDVAEHINVDYEDMDEPERKHMQTILDASIQYVSDYTSIPRDELDAYESFPIAIYALCQSMWDNRAYYVDKSNVNMIVSSILNMYRRNYI